MLYRVNYRVNVVSTRRFDNDGMDALIATVGLSMKS